MQTSSSKHIKAIANLASTIHSLSTVEDIAWAITQEIIEDLEFEDCVIYTLDRQRQVLTQVAAYGEKNGSQRTVKDPIQIKLGEHIVGKVAETGQSELIHDTANDNRYLVDDKQRASELTVPIKVGNEVIGVIDSEHSEKDFYTRDDLETVKAMANIVAIQLQNALEGKKKSRQIEELQELISLMLNHSESALLFEGVDKRIIMTNQAFCDGLGPNKKPEDYIGAFTPDLADEFGNVFIDKEAFVKRVQELKANKKPVKNEELRLKHDRYVSRDFIPVFYNDEIIGYYWQYDDITDKVHALHQAQNDLEQEKGFNKVNKNLVSIASHEFRTPLTSIKSTVDLLVSNSDMFDKDAIIKRLERISRATDNMSDLLDDIMALGNLENFKKEKPELEWLCQDDVIDMANEIVEDFMPDRQVNVKKENLFAFKTRLSRNKLYLVIKNLLTNADKYSEPDTPIEVLLQLTNNIAHITVKDIGIGIPKEQQDSIFDPFERGSNTRKRKGTGLGLFISKRAAEILDGTLSLKSEINKGTEVTLSFPV